MVRQRCMTPQGSSSAGRDGGTVYNDDPMDPDVQAVLEMLDELTPVPTGPVHLSPAYLRAVRAIEDHPDNRNGADKTFRSEGPFGR